MLALIPSYEYDIFISYRHNDNRSGWVTEFVKNLQEELSATIKERKACSTTGGFLPCRLHEVLAGQVSRQYEHVG